MDTLSDVARAILAVVFAVAAVAKLLDLPTSRRTMAAFGVPPRLARRAGTALPFAELATVVLLAIDATARIGGIAALVLLLAFIGGISASLSRGETPNCNCFGQISAEPIGARTLVRNGVLTVLAVLVTVNGPGAGLLAWTGEQTAQTLAVLLALAVVGGVMAYLAMRGKLRQADADYLRLQRISAQLPRDLPVGMRAPAFELSDLRGNRVSLASLWLRGRPVMLLFLGPNCGPCVRLMPELARWNAALTDRVTFAVISNGGLAHEQIAEHLRPLGDDVVALVQEDQEVADSYRVLATPTAIVVDTDGMIASGSAGGPEEIEALVRVVLDGAPSPGAPRDDLVAA
jgi:thiol-disulfide isomerase/thioredoxin/uncharacterized membrane protein YphA (DoxX/SURF4 family)